MMPPITHDRNNEAISHSAYDVPAGGPMSPGAAARPNSSDPKGIEGRRAAGAALGGSTRVFPPVEDSRLATAHRLETLARDRSPEHTRRACGPARRNASPSQPRAGQGRFDRG